MFGFKTAVRQNTNNQFQSIFQGSRDLLVGVLGSHTSYKDRIDGSLGEDNGSERTAGLAAYDTLADTSSNAARIRELKALLKPTDVERAELGARETIYTGDTVLPGTLHQGIPLGAGVGRRERRAVERARTVWTQHGSRVLGARALVGADFAQVIDPAIQDDAKAQEMQWTRVALGGVQAQIEQYDAAIAADQAYHQK